MTGVSFEICSLDEQNWKGWKFEIEATALIADARPIPCKVGAALAHSHDCFAAHQQSHPNPSKMQIQSGRRVSVRAARDDETEKRKKESNAYHSDSELVGDAGRCLPVVTPTSRYEAGIAGR